MIRLYVGLLLCVLFVLPARAQKGVAVPLTAITDSIAAYDNVWAEQLSTLGNTTKDYTLLKPARLRMEAYIDNTLAAIKKQKDAKASADLHAAVVAYLQYKKNLVSKRYAAFEELTPQSTEPEIKKCVDKLLDDTQEEDDYKKMISALAAIAGE